MRMMWQKQGERGTEGKVETNTRAISYFGMRGNWGCEDKEDRNLLVDHVVDIIRKLEKELKVVEVDDDDDDDQYLLEETEHRYLLACHHHP